jgi:hypothetical protein
LASWRTSISAVASPAVSPIFALRSASALGFTEISSVFPSRDTSTHEASPVKLQSGLERTVTLFTSSSSAANVNTTSLSLI